MCVAENSSSGDGNIALFFLRHVFQRTEVRSVQKERQREIDLRVGERQEETSGSLRTSMFWHMKKLAHAGKIDDASLSRVW